MVHNQATNQTLYQLNVFVRSEEPDCWDGGMVRCLMQYNTWCCSRHVILDGATGVKVIPERFRSKLSDFHRSGYDRGHMAPALNHKSSQQDMDDTFFLTNMSPQV